MITLHHVLWALVNAVWQSAVLAGVVLAATKTLRRMSAAQRYAMWGAVLIATALLPFANLALLRISYRPLVPVPVGSEPQAVLAAASAAGVTAVSASPQNRGAAISVTKRATAMVPDSEQIALQASTQETRLQSLERAALGGKYDGWLIVLWIVVANLLIARLAVGYLRLSSLKKALLYRELSVQEQAACTAMTSRPNCHRLCIRDPRAVRDRICPAREVVRHECAHVGRWDDYANLLKQVLMALFWFNPVVHAVAKALDLEREIACDDAAASAQSDRAEFARCLCDMALSNAGRGWLPVTGLARNKRQLVVRVAQLLDRNHSSSTRLNALARAGVASVAFAAIPLALVQLGASVASPSAAATHTLSSSCTLPTHVRLQKVRSAALLAHVAVHAVKVAPTHPAVRRAHPNVPRPIVLSPHVRQLLHDSREAVGTVMPAVSSARADAASMASSFSIAAS